MIQFDVIVPTFQRYKDLPVFFERNFGLKNENVHIWIIDDCSPDFDQSVIPNWNNLTLIRLEQNRGQAYARNVAIDRGNAPYIISLDDDAWFEDCDIALDHMTKKFNEYPDMGCLMFNISTPSSGYSEMADGTILAMHVTCGCAFRRSALASVGGFSGFLHSQAEEVDLSIRFYKQNWSIRFAKEIKAFHNFIPHIRSLSWYYNARHNTTRNDLLIVVMYYPLILVFPFVIGKYLSHLIFAIKNKVSVFKTGWFTLIAFFGFLRLLPLALQRRQPLSLAKFKFWRSLFINK